MGNFGAERDMRVVGTPMASGALHLRSDGLAARGLPELELVGVPVDRAREGGVIINQIAEYTANHARIEPGQRWGMEGPRCGLVARVVRGSTAGTLRIEEPLDGMRPLATLLSTVLLWRAEQAFEAGDEAAGVATLRESIAYFPGDPLRRRGEPDFGGPYNWENHLAYAALAEHEAGADVVARWQEAAARSGLFERDQLGDAAPTLARLEKRTLLARARVILDRNRQVRRDEPLSELLFVTLSPIWRPAYDASGAPKAVRRTNVVLRRHAFSGDPLLAEPALLETAVDLVLAHKQQPVALAWLTEPVVNHWEGGAGQAPFVPAGTGYVVGDHLLSRALALVARYTAAGMTPHEVRVAFGFVEDAAARASALEKQRAQITQIVADQTAAMRPPGD